MQSPSYPNLPDSALGKIRDRISYNRDGADKAAKGAAKRMHGLADDLVLKGGRFIAPVLDELAFIEFELRRAAMDGAFADGMDAAICQIGRADGARAHGTAGEVDGE